MSADGGAVDQYLYHRESEPRTSDESDSGANPAMGDSNTILD